MYFFQTLSHDEKYNFRYFLLQVFLFHATLFLLNTIILSKKIINFIIHFVLYFQCKSLLFYYLLNKASISMLLYCIDFLESLVSKRNFENIVQKHSLNLKLKCFYCISYCNDFQLQEQTFSDPNVDKTLLTGLLLPFKLLK